MSFEDRVSLVARRLRITVERARLLLELPTIHGRASR